MSDDALFQSGMGAIDAPRTEEFFARPAFARPRPRPGVFRRLRGNSAKALIKRRIPGTIPS